MSLSLPKVSIVTSTYKHEKYLRQAIDSVLSQDYPNIEYIVINDGSPDGTEDILRSYGNQFHWETQKNMGEIPTLNRAFAMASGELIGKLSSDDYLYPTSVSEVVRQFVETPELIVVYTDFDLVNENGSLIKTIVKPDFDAVQAVREHLCLPGTGALFRKEIFEKLGGFYTGFRIVSDMDFWWRASLYGKMSRVPKSLSAFRQHETSQSNQGGTRMAEETVQCVQRFYSMPDLPAKFTMIKNTAFSNAFYVAATQVALEKDRKMSRRYLLRSFQYSPANYLMPKNWVKARSFIDIIMPIKTSSLLPHNIKR